MLDTISPLIKLLKLEKVAIDNIAFRLHYKVTVPLFILFSILITAKQNLFWSSACAVMFWPLVAHLDLFWSLVIADLILSWTFADLLWPVI